jgi:hypothetical protein
MPPRGIFGVPHGVLSSTDEWIAVGTGIVVLFVAIFYDGDLEMRPLSGAAVAGLVVVAIGSLIAPPSIAGERHIFELVVTGPAIVYRRGYETLLIRHV